MIADTITWDSVRNEILADPRVRTEYDSLSPELELARVVIGLREAIFHFNHCNLIPS